MGLLWNTIYRILLEHMRGSAPCHLSTIIVLSWLSAVIVSCSTVSCDRLMFRGRLSSFRGFIVLCSVVMFGYHRAVVAVIVSCSVIVPRDIVREQESESDRPSQTFTHFVPSNKSFCRCCYVSAT